MGNTYDEDDDDLYREEDLNSETTIEESVPETYSSVQSGSVAPVTDFSTVWFLRMGMIPRKMSRL